MNSTTLKMPTSVNEKDGRRIQRISLPLPTRVEVRVDTNVSWSEVTRLSDVSAFGAGFSLKRPVKRGRLVLLTIPMPRQLRCYDYSESQYKIWGLVRRCIPVVASEEEKYMVGVAFTGKMPPRSFAANPATLFDTTQREETGLWRIVEANLRQDESHLPKDERRQTRFHIPEPLILELTDDFGSVVRSESTVAENISFSGAAVFTTLHTEMGDFVRIKSERHKLSIIAIVRGSRAGHDGLRRLHLEFIDRFFPLDGLE